MNREKKNNLGFTLIEMMIVTEIIAILVAIAIPSLLRTRIQTNESSAVQNLKTVATAEFMFNTGKNRFGTWDELMAGSGVGTACIDGNWSDGISKNDYIFTLTDIGDVTFTCMAVPARPGATGIRTFSVNESGEILMITPSSP